MEETRERGRNTKIQVHIERILILTEFVPGKLVVKTGVRSESSAVADEGGSWKIVSVTVSVTVTVSTFPGSCRDQKLRRLDRFWRP